MPEFTFQSHLPVSAEKVFSWHEHPGAFERLNPPWNPVRIISRSDGIHDGCQVKLAVPLPFLPAQLFTIPWTLEHRNYRSGVSFQDIQRHGPFSSWEHTHSFHDVPEGGSLLDDRILFTPPFRSTLGRFVAPFIHSQLQSLFRYRHAITGFDLCWHNRFCGQPRKHVLVTGASGLVGSALVPFFTAGGHRVGVLGRGSAVSPHHAIKGIASYLWTPDRPDLALPNFPCDAVIHLAGENIAAQRWSADFKNRIRNSRVSGTSNLCRALAQLPTPPRVLVCASAVGYYGDCHDREISEEQGRGSGFLAQTCQEWEHACQPAIDAGIRVVHLRIGVVLDPRGGALARMLLPFRLGAGGRLGNGNQFMSWISLDDLLAIFYWSVMNDSIEGPYNAVSPQPICNAEFTRVLGTVLKRPSFFPVPAPLLRMALGEFADEALLASTRAMPRRLLESGFTFQYPRLADALRHCLGR